MNPLDSRNLNSLWCSVWIETWVREGLVHAVICPGSRSTPLTMALARHPRVQAVPVLDERSAAFYALGLARSSGHPVVIVCTSGSAGSHFLPAVIEAKETGTPLIVVTADRPPELRDCAAGQTIDQQKLFGDYAIWYHEMALPELTEGLFVYLRQTARQAWRRADQAGPVHLNAPFRDPLPPVSDRGEATEFATQLDEAFFELPKSPARTELTLAHQLTTQRGVIVAGQAMPTAVDAYVARLVSYARATGWPILADGLSPLRFGAAPDVVVVTTYDVILRNERVARELTPRYVLGLEGWPTSKALRRWIEQSQAEVLMVSPLSGSRDAGHGRTREITAPATCLRFDDGAKRDSDYARAWQTAEHGVRQALAAWMQSKAADGFEGKLAWRLGRDLSSDHNLVLASSMPVRIWEYFSGASENGPRVFSNRGANGIDGNLSAACGVAAGSGRPTILLSGDLAFLHDAGGLALQPHLTVPVTVVVINNQGGGIFEHLPVAKFDPEFERYFATPQQVDLAALCSAYRVGHRIATTAEELVSADASAGIEVVEIRTDRKQDAATMKKLFRDIARSVSVT